MSVSVEKKNILSKNNCLSRSIVKNMEKKLKKIGNWFEEKESSFAVASNLYSSVLFESMKSLKNF